ncbi:MAG: hypothetical protein H6617_04225 [Bdellovibrionaceae bacterium]|nr:hypothetical protein [Pseudobdellovibrionaceae bacterium]
MNRRILFLFLLILSVGASATEVATPFKVRRLEINARRELNVYKDPSMFLPDLGEIHADPLSGWESLMENTPLLTTVEGPVCFLQLAAATPFKNFGLVSYLYQLADSRLKSPVTAATFGEATPMIVPVQLCGESAYSDSLGFVLEEDLKAVQQARVERGLPPTVSTQP